MAQSDLAKPPAWIFLDKVLPDESSTNGNGHYLDADRIERGVGEGERDESLFKLACRYRALDLPEEEIRAKVLEAAARCNPPFDPREAERKVRQALRYPPGKRMKVVFGTAPDFIMPLPENEVMPFPMEVLPGPLYQLVEAGARSIGCPPDFIAVPMLAAIGCAIGNSRELEVKRGWTIGPRMFAAVVADPGSKKSPALDLAIDPIAKRQRKAHAEWKKADEEYEQKAKAYETEFSIWSQAKKEAAKRPSLPVPEQPVKPKEPIEPHFMTTNTTIESLAQMLAEWPRGIGVFHDELTAWARSMNMYRSGKGDDRQQWLKFWTGAGIRVTRKGQKPIFLAKPFVTVAGCLPPDVLDELRDERGREDGFVHRLLFTMPDHIDLPFTREGVDPRLEQMYEQVFADLWAKCQPTTDENGELTPVVVQFTPDGLALFEEWHADHLGEMKSDQFPIELRGPWAKLESYCLRLALILQEARFICGESDGESVDEVSVGGAGDLIDYFKSHTRRVYDRLTTTPEDKRAMAVLRWIDKHGGSATNREILRSHVAGVKRASEVKKVLKDLEDRHFGTRAKIGNAPGFMAGKLAGDDESVA